MFDIRHSPPSVLFLTHRVPHPPNRGDRIRAYNILRYLAPRADVYLGCLADEPVSEESRAVLQELTKECAIVPVDRTARWLRAVGSLASGRPATQGLFSSKTLRKRISDWAGHVRFHAVLVYCSSMYQYSQIETHGSARQVVDLVDVDSQKWLDYARGCRGPKGWLYQLEAMRLRRLERQIAEEADAVTLVSSQELQLFRREVLGGCSETVTRYHAITNGVDLDYFRPDSPSGEGPLALDQETATASTCLFVGALDYKPNIDGIRWFCRQVWPAVLARFPQATFAIVGRGDKQCLRSEARLPGVNLVGEVDDTRPYFQAADIVVCPLRIARGIQNKVLEGLAMERPVIASPEALEGLQVVPGREVFTATTGKEWHDSITRVLGDLKKAGFLARNGREYVEQRHSWNACLAELSCLLQLGDSNSAIFDHAGASNLVSSKVVATG